MTEQRKSARKILKVRALLAMDGQAPRQVRTVDVAANGVSVTVAEPVAAGQLGQVGFDLLVDGRTAPVAGRVKVAYCIFSNDEFKIGLQFLNLDVNGMNQLQRFLR